MAVTWEQAATAAADAVAGAGAKDVGRLKFDGETKLSAKTFISFSSHPAEEQQNKSLTDRTRG